MKGLYKITGTPTISKKLTTALIIAGIIFLLKK
jgi:hypothetical protein